MDIQEKLMQEKISKRQKELPLEPKQEVVEDIPKVKKEANIPVFPKPERMFPEDARPKGGEYLNPITKEAITGKNVSNANIKITPEGKPSFKVSDDDVAEVGSTGKGKSIIRVNLFKKKAGWKWQDAPEGYEDAPTLVSVEHKGKHFYTLETDFDKGVNLSRYPDKKSEPRLRPTVTGQIELGPQVGTISVRGKEHPVYSKIRTYNEGGAVMQNQMQMAFMNEGGMKDDGGETEPTSGNKVPSGSLKEEVKDDIPAMLSEGEFVFPADVVRYIGLETLMKMRQDAKQGLKMMEKMGQLGNPEEAELPDDIPFGMADLIVVSGEMKDKEKKAEGGAVGLANGGSLFDDPRFQTGDTGQDPTVYTPEEEQEIKGALDEPMQPSDIQIKKIINPSNPDDFMMWSFDKEGNPLYPLPEGYVVDDTPVEDSYSNIISRREQPTESDSGDSDRMVDPRDSAGMTLPRADEFADPDQYLGDEFGLFKDGKPIRLQKTTLDNLKSEYETLKAIRPELTFQQYYNLPTYDKVRFSLRSSLGRDPSNAEIQNAITQAQKSPTGLLSFLNPVISTIKSILSPSADIGGKIKPEVDRARRERATAVTNLTNLIDPRKTSPYGDAKGVVSEADYQKYKRDTELQSQAMFPSTGKVGKVDDFLLGVRRDPTGKKPPTIFKGNRNPDGSPKYETLTTDVLSRLEKNRQEATDPQKALDRMQEQARALRPDIQAAEESAGRGDLDTVAQNEAFEQQMREAQAIARGTPRSPSRGGGGQRTPSDFGASGYANEFTGLGSGPSIPDFDRFYVGGVPTKPMKPQRLKKGGIASPKAKPKKMKKGGLASSRKK